MRSGAMGVLLALLVSGCADGSLTEDNPSTVLPPMGIQGAGTTGNAGGAGTTPGMAGRGAPGGAGAGGITSGNAGTTGGGAGGGAGMMVAGGGAGGAAPMAGAGAGAGGAGGTGGMPPVGDATPIIPDVSGECPTFRDGTITFGGLSGIAVVAGSKAAGPTAPMVFYWHGTGSFAGEYAGHAAIVSGVREEGGVLISFQSTTGGDLLSGTAIFGAGDFDLTDQLLACAVANHNVDPRRVFSTGCSAGGLFAGAMGALRSNYMAAVAPNSGGLTTRVQFQNGWTPALMTIHGAPGTDVVIIDFSNSSKTADDAYKMRGGFVINCNHGGFHCGGTPLAPDVWEFFKAHPYGTKPSPWTALPAGFNSDCEIY